MTYKVNEKGWEHEDRTDADMAADISKDRNMLDFVAYNNNGYPFVTLAGIMKAANKESLSVKICEVTETEDLYSVFVKVSTKPDEQGNYESSFSSRDEAKKRETRNPATGNWESKLNPHARVVAINVAIKNAFKNLLYGSTVIKEMMDEFLEKNPEPPKPPRKQQKAKTKEKPAEQKQETKQETEQETKQETEQETEQEDPKYVDIPSSDTDKTESEAWAKWKEGLKEKPLEGLVSVCHKVYNDSIHEKIFVAKGLDIAAAVQAKFGYKSDKFTQEDAVEWLDILCLCAEGQGWLWKWVEAGGKATDENKETK